MVSARTWISPNGETELEGDFKSFDKNTNQVTIVVDREVVKFDLSKLSEKDQAFVKRQGEKELNVRELLQKATLHQVVDGEMKEVKFEAEPEYYLFYFTASW